MAGYAELKGASLDARNRLADALMARARKELNLSDDEIVLRELRPEDVGYPTSEFTNSVTAATTATLINVTLADNRYVGIYGVRYAQTGTQSISQLKVTRKGSDVRYWQIQGTQLLENGTIYFDDPVIVDQTTVLTITGYPVTTNTAEKIVFIGLVAEKAGSLVAKG